MRSWKPAVVLALASLNLTCLNGMAAEPAALPKTMNDDSVTLKGAALYRKINEVTRQNIADMMAVPTDMNSLARPRGRDFEYTPVIRDKEVAAPEVLTTPPVSLTYKHKEHS